MEGSQESVSATAVCAVHPTTPSVGICERCGSFMCTACSAGNGMCNECGARGTSLSWAAASRAGTIASYVFYAYIAYSFVCIALNLAPLDDARREDVFLALVPLELVFLLGLAVTFFRWMNRGFTAMGPTADFGPNSWGWFFAPVFSLWRPYQAITTLYGLRAGMRPTPVVFPAWWVAFLLRGFVGMAVVGAGSIALVFAGLLDIVAAFLAIRVIAEIDRPAQSLDEL